MRIIAEPQMLALIQSIAEESPNFVYPDEYPYREGPTSPCLYRTADNSGPACLIGHVLDRLGVLDQAEEATAAHQLLPHLSGVWFTPAAVNMAQRVQDRQDTGMSWGECLRKELERHASGSGHMRDTAVVRPTPESDWTLHTDGPSDIPF